MIRLKVREIAESRGFNMSTLSRKADVSYNTIQNIYRNPHKSVAFPILEKLARTLEVSVADLIEEVDDDTAR